MRTWVIAVSLLLAACTRSKRSGPVSDGGARLPALSQPVEGRIDIPGAAAEIIAVERTSHGPEPLVVWRDDHGMWVHAGGATQRLGDAEPVASAWDGERLYLVGPRSRLTVSASGAVLSRAAGVDGEVVGVLVNGKQVIALSQQCDPDSPCDQRADISLDAGATWLPRRRLTLGPQFSSQLVVVPGSILTWFLVGDVGLGWLHPDGKAIVLDPHRAASDSGPGDHLRFPELSVTQAACSGARPMEAWSDAEGIHVTTLDEPLHGQRPPAANVSKQPADVLSLACQGDDLVLAAQTHPDRGGYVMTVASSHDGGATWQHDGPWPLFSPLVAVVGAPPHARIYFSQQLPGDFEPAEDAPVEQGRHLARGVIRVLEQRDGRFAGAATRTGLREQSLAYVGTDWALHDGHAWAVLGGDPDLVARTEFDHRDFTDFASPPQRAVTGLRWTLLPR